MLHVQAAVNMPWQQLGQAMTASCDICTPDYQLNCLSNICSTQLGLYMHMKRAQLLGKVLNSTITRTHGHACTRTKSPLLPCMAYVICDSIA
jgi:hypothetical protein